MSMDVGNSRGALALTIPVLALGTSCQTDGDDENGFRITAIEFDGESTITLTFSEPVAELGDVDPSSFRLSYATTYRFTYTYQGTTYVDDVAIYMDLGVFVGSGDYYDFESVTVTALMPGSSPNRVVLQTSHAWGADACDGVAYTEAMMEMYGFVSDVGLFLHHAAGDIPLTSTSGSALANIGADWVLSGESYFNKYEYGFADLRPQLRIPCP
jgi:hypothetical protein